MAPVSISFWQSARFILLLLKAAHNPSKVTVVPKSGMSSSGLDLTCWVTPTENNVTRRQTASRF